MDLKLYSLHDNTKQKERSMQLTHWLGSQFVLTDRLGILGP
jgi:hypothetical protein